MASEQRSPAIRWVVLTAMAASLTLGCAQAQSPSNPERSTDPIGQRSDSDEGARAADAYRNAIGAFEASLLNPAEGTDRLPAWWAGPALASAVSEVNTWAGFGQALRFPDPTLRSLDLVSVTTEGDMASLRACFIDDGQTIDVTSGSVLDAQATTTLEDVELRRTPTGWVVTERRLARQTNGVTSCDA
jgi:hypothetical protein